MPTHFAVEQRQRSIELERRCLELSLAGATFEEKCTETPDGAGRHLAVEGKVLGISQGIGSVSPFDAVNPSAFSEARIELGQISAIPTNSHLDGIPRRLSAKSDGISVQWLTYPEG
jgi:hypothetical protein